MRKGSLVPIFPGAGFIYRKGSPFELFSVEGGNCRFSLRFGAHGDKPEPTRPACLPIADQVSLHDGAKPFKKILKIRLGRTEWKISNVKLHCFINRLVICLLQSRFRRPDFKSPPSKTHVSISPRFELVQTGNNHPLPVG
jgi:hypothetical protein